MTRNLDSAASHGDRVRARAYLREFSAAMLTYGAVLPLVIAYGGLDGDRPARFVWALAPMVPAFGVVWVLWRHLQRQDEYQRVLLLQGLALGFGVMIMATLTVAFLAMAGLRVSAATLWALYGAGMVGWLFGSVLVARRSSRP